MDYFRRYITVIGANISNIHISVIGANSVYLLYQNMDLAVAHVLFLLCWAVAFVCIFLCLFNVSRYPTYILTVISSPSPIQASTAPDMSSSEVRSFEAPPRSQQLQKKVLLVIWNSELHVHMHLFVQMYAGFQNVSTYYRPTFGQLISTDQLSERQKYFSDHLTT